MVIDIGTTLTVDGVLVAIGAGIIGFVGHELIHLLVLYSFGRKPSIELEMEWLLFAAVPPEGTPRWQNAIALMAPVVWAVLGIWKAFDLGVVSMPLSLDGLLFVVAFGLAALPSPGDIYVLLFYRPDANTVGVSADG